MWLQTIISLAVALDRRIPLHKQSAFIWLTNIKINIEKYFHFRVSFRLFRFVDFENWRK